MRWYGHAMTHDITSDSLARFLSIMAALRNPSGGCPWDLKQTFETLRPLVIEEAYEVADAVAAGPAAVCEELGDLVSLIGLFAQIASEQSLFSFNSIVEGISDKLVRRHPHVFGETTVSGTEEVLRNWEQIKQQERKESAATSPKGLLDGIPRSLPALLKAHQIGTRCARVGFDWGTREGVADKVREELGEFLNEVAPSSEDSPQGVSVSASSRAFEEFGDLLFTLAQYARHMGINPEEALSQANDKFTERFRVLERLARETYGDKLISDLSAADLDQLWLRAKEQLR
jgi:ATP diphosphatase